MRTLAIILILLNLCLTGCALMRTTVSAEPIDPNLTDGVKDSSNDTARYVGRIIFDSETKCAQFLADLAAAENSSNAGLDMTTTVFSALATAFVPISTVHSLTAGATISSGWKTAIDTNIYAKASIANYAQAIQLTYYKNIKTIIDSLSDDPDAKVNASRLLAQIQEAHQGCSLAAAQLTVSQTLQGAGQQPKGESSPTAPELEGTSKQMVNVKGPFTRGQIIVVNAISQQIAAGAPQIIKTKVTSKDSPAEVAKDLADSLNAYPSLRTAKVTATVKTVGTTVFLELHAPSGTVIQWKFGPSGFDVVSQPPTNHTKTLSIIPPGGSLIGQ
ncbi:Uncharacterised protein [Burkholderia pseudomallei]|nr:Uncharacterised protein [Burkholderia pseudomallei]VCN38296.1 Uncharacterised protein [Burkholderia pseudomallei]VCN49639.1 Uncharacterised protein [Burkholderia pseudomallei]VCN64712.1 Uncharacterised protein [Burkholderia pseudomallei]VCN69653.1 Uncharacterised protein [Burkholderia pseudomallei]